MIITVLFSLLMAGIFCVVCYALFTQHNFLSQVGNKIMFSAPTILTSLGILGTFVGISYALFEFDTRNLDNSISSLLDGMKTAFITSAIGITLSIVLKLLMLILGKEDEQAENRLIETHLQQQTDSLNKTLPDLINKLIVLSEQNQRANMLFERKLFKSLKSFNQDLTEQASQNIINALENVVINFNDRLVHQFGDNFARLDDSVKEMVQWQNNYKTLLEKLSRKHELNAHTLVEVKDAMLTIEQSIANIPVLVKDFEQLIKFNQKQIGRIGDEMMIFSDIKDKALNSFPVIENHFTKMAAHIEQSTLQFSQNLTVYTANMNKNLSEISRAMVVNFEENTQQLQEKNAHSYQQLSDSMIKLETLLTSLNKTLNNNLTQLQHSFNQSIEQTTKEQVRQFKSVMEEISQENQNFLNSLRKSKKLFSLFGRDNQGEH